MLIVIILCALASIAAGIAAKYILEHRGDEFIQITKTEVIVGTLICSIVVIPLITWIGFSIVRNSTISYNEFYSGLETKAEEHVTTCRRDGSCDYNYDCDPYTVMEARTRSVYAGTDSKGNAQYRTETYYVPVTHYHSCPYVTEEYNYYIKDTLGETYSIGGTRFAKDPKPWRSRSIPGNVGRGQPARWLEAKARIDSGNPGGTTKRAKYDNYIQASQEDIYQKVSSSIDAYKRKDLLPKVATKVYDYYMADKVYLTSVPAGTSAKDWQTEFMRLNGKIGKEKHGDLHVVLVDSNAVPEADDYSAALDAYWQSSALGKNTISKNGIVVVVGFSGQTVTWSRAFTGMPVGNESLIVHLREDLTNSQAAPAALAEEIGSLIFAGDNQGFDRVQMSDYSYLFSAIQPSGWQKFWIAFVAFLISLGVWFAMAALDVVIPIRIPTKE